MLGSHASTLHPCVVGRCVGSPVIHFVWGPCTCECGHSSVVVSFGLIMHAKGEVHGEVDGEFFAT